MNRQLAIYWHDLHPVKLTEIRNDFGQDFEDRIDKTKPIAIVEVDHVDQQKEIQ